MWPLSFLSWKSVRQENVGSIMGNYLFIFSGVCPPYSLGIQVETSGSLLASEGHDLLSNDVVTVANPQTVTPSFLAGNVAPELVLFFQCLQVWARRWEFLMLLR